LDCIENILEAIIDIMDIVPLPLTQVEEDHNLKAIIEIESDAG
jgi:hypothetical protein